jgi:hypothetical protein
MGHIPPSNNMAGKWGFQAFRTSRVMNILISWSKPQSHEIALTLYEWLPKALPNAKPWVSSEDLTKGKSWQRELGETLAAAKVSVVCMTRENITSSWLFYEAGAIAAKADDILVCPFLIDASLRAAIKDTPLGQWQDTVPTEADVFKLMRSLNKQLGHHEDLIKTSFEHHWPALKTKLDDIRSRYPDCRNSPSLPSSGNVDAVRDSLPGVGHSPTLPSFSYFDETRNSFAGIRQSPSLSSFAAPDVVALSSEAGTILKMASEGDGTISVIDRPHSLVIRTQDALIAEETNPRRRAKWVEALETLEQLKYVERRNKHGYRLTAQGHRATEESA